LFTGQQEWGAWGALLHTVRTGEMAQSHVHGTSPFEYFEKHPEEGKVFDEAMAAFTALVAMAVAAVYDFSPFKRVVDVGGGSGALLIGILKANPHLRGTVFDLPRAVEGAKKQIVSAGLADRCDTVAGDFFESVPTGGDAYLIKHVIHDWDDEQAIRILKSCHRAMSPQAKLLIIEGVYPEHIDHSLASRGAALNDCNMLVVTGGRQRSEAEFRELFKASGFSLTRIVPTPAASSVIEAARS
jgi:tRNA A58 N-methylase Trm61